jgi:DNA-directed RNA polymerase specialized sigma24 family protein
MKNPMDSAADEQLIHRLREGKTSAIDEIYRRYAKKLYVLFRYTMHAANPEDLVHDVFLKVIESAHIFNPQKASFVEITVQKCDSRSYL